MPAKEANGTTLDAGSQPLHTFPGGVPCTHFPGWYCSHLTLQRPGLLHGKQQPCSSSHQAGVPAGGPSFFKSQSVLFLHNLGVLSFSDQQHLQLLSWWRSKPSSPDTLDGTAC